MILSPMQINELLKRLKKQYPDTETELSYRNEFELLVSVVLSAQATDKQINKLTPGLFESFPSAELLSKAKPEKVENLIRSSGYYKQKTKSIINLSKKIIQEHGGKVPMNMNDLIKLPGVGRKTANVLLGQYGEVSGVVVDTHVGRISRRLGLTNEKNAEKVEIDLMKALPKEEWIDYSGRLIRLGRQECNSRKPKCFECFLSDICPSNGKAEKIK